MTDTPPHDTDGTSESRTARYDRRTLLRACASAGMVGLAGCEAEPITDGPASGGAEGTGTFEDSPSSGRLYWQVRHGMTASEYQDTFDDMVFQEGLRLTDVSGYGEGGEDRYAAIWTDVSGPRWRAHHGLTAAGYEEKRSEYADDGFRPTRISGYTSGGTPHFAGIFQQHKGPRTRVVKDLTASEYQREFDDRVDRGYRPIDVTGYIDDGEAHYAAIFEQFDGPRWHSHHGLSGSGFQNKFDEYVDGDGLRLTDVAGFGVGGTPLFVGTWQAFSGPAWRAYYGMDGSGFQSRVDDLSDRGYRMTSASGYNEGGRLRFAGIWERDREHQHGFDDIDATVARYMQNNRVPGLSLAITRDERLVYARGYGYANREARRPMRAHHRHRIASISKPITGAAILRLMEDGQLSLGDRVFGSGGLLGTRYGTPTHGYTSSGNTTPVTVHHLLQHASGWGQHNQDPMFMHSEMDHPELIQWVVANRPLQFPPGSQMAYSNFGYCVLGRVIEAVSGQDYETYVQNAVLNPAGVDGMVIAGDTRPERRADEAAYYDSGAYGMEVARMDAHGGWIASPTDLLRLTVHLDGFPNKPDVLGSSAMAELADSDTGSGAYGEGWVLGPSARFHDGCFPGTVGVLVRRDDGTSFAALVNTRPPNDRCAGSLQSTLNQAVSNVGNWPGWDLF